MIGSAMHRLAALFLCVLGACAEESGPDASSAAPVEIVGLAGLEARIAANHGRPLVVNLWAMW